MKCIKRVRKETGEWVKKTDGGKETVEHVYTFLDEATNMKHTIKSETELGFIQCENYTREAVLRATEARVVNTI